MKPKIEIRPISGSNRLTLLLGACSLLASTGLQAQDAEQSEEAKLAMQLNNPVANLMSFPLQSNWDFGIGPSDAYKYTLNIQPVLPFTLNEDWNLISRTILPVIDAESPAPGIDDASGLGSTTESLFFSPQKPTESGIIWGAGPIFLIPTATDDLLGSDKWGMGPTALALRQTGGWTYGALTNQIWSFGDGVEAVNATYLQPFVSYTTKSHTTIAFNSESTYDWEAGQWTIPFNLMVAQLVKIGKLPFQFQAGARWYAEAPDGGPDWGLRFTVTLLLPKS